MHGYECLELPSTGTYRGARYLLAGFVEPAPGGRDTFDPDQNADDRGVSLARVDVWTDRDGSVVHTNNVELMCLDTCHGRPHVDYRFLRPDVERDRTVSLHGAWPYSKMRTFLLANWRGFVDDARTYQDDEPPS